MKIGEITKTDSGRVPIFRDHAWPPGDDQRILTINKSSGWAVGEADQWTWSLDFDVERGGGTPELSIQADSVTITGDSDEDLVLKFSMTPEQTGSMSGQGQTVFHVDLVSDDGGDESIWGTGSAIVNDGVGGRE